MGTCVGIGSRVQNVDVSALTSNPDTESQPVDLEKASLPFYLQKTPSMTSTCPCGAQELPCRSFLMVCTSSTALGL